MTTITERLLHAIKAAKTTQADVAIKLGISPQSFNAIVRGRTPGRRYMGAIAQLLGVDAEWLETGRGASPASLRPEVASPEGPLSTIDPANPSAGFINPVVLSILKLRELQVDSPAEFMRSCASLPYLLRRFIASDSGHPLPYGCDVGDYLELLRVVGVELSPEESHAFSVAHNHHWDKHLRDVGSDMAARVGSDTALPYGDFQVVRSCVWLGIVQRIQLDEDFEPLASTLKLLWARQCSGTAQGAWSGLDREYKEDLKHLALIKKDPSIMRKLVDFNKMSSQVSSKIFGLSAQLISHDFKSVHPEP